MYAVTGVVVGAFILAVVLTGAARRYAIQHHILDTPNARSSHTRVTPRGGGIAIALTVLGGLIVLGISSLVSVRVLGAFCGGIPVAIIGWVDDKRGVSARARLAVHLFAGGWSVAWLGGLPELTVGVGLLQLGWTGSVLAALGIAWSINVFNFMDGIDGLAASESCVVCAVAGTLLLLKGQAGLALSTLLVAGAAGGFLVWNWQPARIFMGDVSSGLLGYLVSTLALASERSGAVPLLAWFVLVLVFTTDATCTLVRRILAGERWYEAHRTHAYQLAVIAGYSHQRVTLAAVALTLGLSVCAAVGVRDQRLLVPLLLSASLGIFAVWSVCGVAWTRLLKDRKHRHRDAT